MEKKNLLRAILLPISFLLLAVIYKVILESFNPAPPAIRAVYDCAATDLHAEFYGQCVLGVSNVEFFTDPTPKAQAFEELSFTNNPKGSGCQIETNAHITGKYRSDNQLGTHKFRCLGTYIGGNEGLIETWIKYK